MKKILVIISLLLLVISGGIAEPITYTSPPLATQPLLGMLQHIESFSFQNIVLFLLLFILIILYLNQKGRKKNPNKNRWEALLKNKHFLSIKIYLAAYVKRWSIINIYTVIICLVAILISVIWGRCVSRRFCDISNG